MFLTFLTSYADCITAHMKTGKMYLFFNENFLINTRYAKEEKDMRKIYSALVPIFCIKKIQKKDLTKRGYWKINCFVI